MKYFKLVVMLMLVVVVLSGCNEDKVEEDTNLDDSIEVTQEVNMTDTYDFVEMPTLEVSISDKTIQVMASKTDWDGEKISSGDIVSAYMNLISGVNMPMIPYEEIMILDFQGPEPETIEIVESLRRPTGERKYGSSVDKVIEVVYDEEGYYYFTVTKNWAVALSSNSEDYKAENIYKGYEIKCSWEDGQYQGIYGFVIHPEGNQF